MTSRERIIAELERREPDRLPTFEWRIARSIIEAFAPSEDEGDFVEAEGHGTVCCSPSYKHIEVIDADTFVDEFKITRH